MVVATLPAPWIWVLALGGSAEHQAQISPCAAAAPSKPGSLALKVALSRPKGNRERCKMQALPRLSQPKDGSGALQGGGDTAPLLPCLSLSRCSPGPSWKLQFPF